MAFTWFLFSSMLLDHDDFEIEAPIGTGEEAVIYLANHKSTNEKHACKKNKYKIEAKKMLHAIDNF